MFVVCWSHKKSYYTTNPDTEPSLTLWIFCDFTFLRKASLSFFLWTHRLSELSIRRLWEVISLLLIPALKLCLDEWICQRSVQDCSHLASARQRRTDMKPEAVCDAKIFTRFFFSRTIINIFTSLTSQICNFFGMFGRRKRNKKERRAVILFTWQIKSVKTGFFVISWLTCLCCSPPLPPFLLSLALRKLRRGRLPSLSLIKKIVCT